MTDAVMQGFDHCRRAGEIHVRYPQRNHVPALVLVPFGATRTAAVYRRVKIKLQYSLPEGAVLEHTDRGAKAGEQNALTAKDARDAKE